jgi:threonine-phosphate decarboxylase
VRNGIPEKVIHGGLVKRCQEITGKRILDFSASINPFPPAVAWDASRAVLDEYPDDTYTRLKETIGCQFNRDTDEIAVGNGSIELIRVFCSVALKPGSGIWHEEPTFGEYELSASLAGAHTVPRMEEASVAFLCNPNNPTGQLRTREQVRALLESSLRPGSRLFLDEAFIELSDPRQSLADVQDEQLVLIRSLTKSFGVPGIRFGYAFGDPGVISRIEVTRPPWSVNAFAESFAIAAFRHYADLERSRELITSEREWLSRECAHIGLGVSPSMANFLLLDTHQNASDLCLRLQHAGILVRDCTSFGLPETIRIAVRSREENRELIEALAACLH